MTDTGQFPGEGQPENAGAPGHPYPTEAVAPADPGAPAPPATFTFLDHGDGTEADGTDEDDLLLMPGAQGAWMEQPPVQGGTHESGGRDTGSVEYGDVRTPPATAAAQPPAAPAAPRRPLHMGPPVPDPTGGVVRSLADRGPAAPAPAPVRPSVPPAAPAPGPEYLDVTTDETGTQQVPRLGEVPQQQPGTWDAQPQPPAATAFVPPQAAGTAAPVGDVPSAVPEAPVATSTGLSAIDAVVAAATGQVHVPPSVSGVPADAAGQVAAVAAPVEAPSAEAVQPAVVVPGEVPQAAAPVDVPSAEAAVTAAEAVAGAPVAVLQDGQPAVGAEQVQDVSAGVPVDAAVAAAQTEQPAAPQAAVPVIPAEPEPVGDALAAAEPVPAAPAVIPQADQPVVAEAGADAAASVEQAVAVAPEAAPPAEQPAEAAAVAPAEPVADVTAVAEAAPQAGQPAVTTQTGVPQTGQAVDAIAASGAAPQADQPVVAEAVAPAEQAAEAAAGADDAQAAQAADAGVLQTVDVAVVADAAPQAGQPAGTAAGAPAAAPQVEQVADAASQAGQPADPAAVAPQAAVAGAEAQAVQPGAAEAAPQVGQPADSAAAAPQVAVAGVEAQAVQPGAADAAPQAGQPADPAAATPQAAVSGAEAQAVLPGGADAAPQVGQLVDPAAAAPQAAVPGAEAQAVQPGGADAAPQLGQPADPAAVAPQAAVSGAEAQAVQPGAADAAPQAGQPVDPAAAAPQAAVPGAEAQAVQPGGADAAPQAGQPTDSDAVAPQLAETPAAADAAPQAAAPGAEAQGEQPGQLAAPAAVAPGTEAPAAQPGAADPAVAEPAPQGPADAPAVSPEFASEQAVAADAPADTPSAPHAPVGVPQPEQATISEPQAPETEAAVHAPAAGSEPQAAQPEQAAAGTDAQPVAEVRIPAPQQAPDEPAAEAEPAVATDPVVVPAPCAAEAEEETARPDVPAATGYGDAEREAVHRVMRERRDIRNGFRRDPVPHEVLLRVLEAAHTAPSVGHSQPWDFVVIRSAETRQAMHELAQRQRDAYAKSLPKGRAKQFKEMKIEAILETPVNIVVTADPTRGGRHTLGRHTQPQMAPYSSALAVENLWLAARAEGLGVGWVSFFDEREMVRALGLPEHLEVVAYLCVGYVDEFPDEPELMQAGWSKRRPLSWVVHEEEYGRRALPGEDPHDLLAETLRGIRPLDAKALGEAWERQKRMTKPSGALGMLEIISAQLCGLSRKCPPPIPEPAAVAIFAGDHGVHAQGVTAWPQEVTSQMVANFLGGGAVCNAFANQVGAEVCVVDVGVAGELPSTPGLLPRKVRPGTADITAGPAMTREEAMRALEVGIETARDLVAAGNKALLTGEMGIANTTVSAALISVYTGTDPAEITGRGTGINDEMHARKIDVVRRALELHQPDPKDPIGVLTAIGGLEHAALVGLILGGASLRTPVILDGVSAGAAALVARAIAPEALAACIAGHRSAEPGHVAALTKLGLRPLVDLDLRLGEGTGALLALPVVQSAARAMHEVATFDTAGVTEKN
ncbi:nicotinate-nucleotide--dimethylbenzimidazole phosphoribosyltransferase [Streptomyces roseoverticillatus]|uniref:nicotinate-nucleotide--dimethylbenzimidazole phosphoribosyltransferase n=1 Tax=Streptomyces roseoverticillatus TaxID=66429 RepID=UPI001F3A1A50|nr:nicotinate-nucleotide--dimethylbenzimidazole phosphoribosyltransferase [Streptomyces roseoverticillatus]MCF3100826.1 nicotinate-nucleotide--dimethylbenzimidazole phosphoribosyltransferase [Streptomyces roseoverticillatus]